MSPTLESLVVEELASKSLRLLVADDHHILRESFLSGFQKYNTVTLIDIVDDVAKIEKILDLNGVDVLLTDIRMPGSPVRQLSIWAQKYPSLKIVLMTGYDFLSPIQLALMSGISGLISKRDGFEYVMQAITIGTVERPFFSPSFQDLEKLFFANTHSSRLTSRELEILQLVAQGMRGRAIAEALKISVKTLENHKQNIMTKLDVHNQVELAVMAHKMGLD